MIKWEQRFSVENVQIDGEHKHLIELLNIVHDLSIRAEDGEDIYDEMEVAIEGLRDYTVEHFRNEEEIFDRTDYMDKDVHKFQHKLFIKKIESIDLQKADNMQGEFLKKLTKELIDWVINHVLIVDKGYVDYINK